MLTNRDRAENGARLLDMAPYEEDQDSALVDILTDLMHYCNQTGMHDFEKGLSAARLHYAAETSGPRR